jgi:hypothetical protein
MGWQHLLSHWRSIFNRANVVVFPDFTLPVKMPPLYVIASHFLPVMYRKSHAVFYSPLLASLV